MADKITIETPVTALRGVGPKTGACFEKLGVRTVGDLLLYFPRSYEDRRNFANISQAEPESFVCITACVITAPRSAHIRKGMDLLKFTVADRSGQMDITFFNAPYLKDSFHTGNYYRFYGKISMFGWRRSMTSPEFEPNEMPFSKTGCIVPRYRLTAGITSAQIRLCEKIALEQCSRMPDDPLPAYIRSRYSLAPLNEALRAIHFPKNDDEMQSARHRLIFEEFFILACALAAKRRESAGSVGFTIPSPGLSGFTAQLPFTPTGAQTRAIEDCFRDMASGAVMNRLIQGDVGSGKTLVAAACMYAVARAGMQSVLMAPTEILARQHMKTLGDFLMPFGIEVGLLTGSMTAKEKRVVKQRLADGSLPVVVGTHALLSEDVSFAALGLSVTDEQHRFGVLQRGTLSEKNALAHTLVMSATPIPRTLALMIYGDLDVSIIDELPPGRTPVATYVVNSSYRERLLAFIRKLVTEGRQVFVVCPKIEESVDEPPDPSLRSAVEHAEELQKVFPDLCIRCIHGKMRVSEKDEIMSATVAGTVQVLVSTTVIEVGVDVPNAALMIIENAERFGLSQLHQLRGRVGRGNYKSYCVLVSDAKNEEAVSRLKAMKDTGNGFKIAEADLALRGPGDFFGARQHGLPEMKLADLCEDMQVMKDAQQAAQLLTETDPELTSPENLGLKKRISTLLTDYRGTWN